MYVKITTNQGSFEFGSLNDKKNPFWIPFLRFRLHAIFYICMTAHTSFCARGQYDGVDIKFYLVNQAHFDSMTGQYN